MLVALVSVEFYGLGSDINREPLALINTRKPNPKPEDPM
jgi:hypothetical protein